MAAVIAKLDANKAAPVIRAIDVGVRGSLTSSTPFDGSTVNL
jgi:hypothetical protein